VEAAEAGQGALMVKGLKSMWRQAAPILRTTLQGVLHRILVEVDQHCHGCFSSMDVALCSIHPSS